MEDFRQRRTADVSNKGISVKNSESFENIQF